MSDGISFSHALAELKAGKRVARKGWNGKDTFLYIKKGSYDHDAIASDSDELSNVHETLFDQGDTGTVTRLPCIRMKTAQGATLEGWLASQTDLLADDWEILPEAA